MRSFRNSCSIFFFIHKNLNYFPLLGIPQLSVLSPFSMNFSYGVDFAAAMYSVGGSITGNIFPGKREKKENILQHKDFLIWIFSFFFFFFPFLFFFIFFSFFFLFFSSLVKNFGCSLSDYEGVSDQNVPLIASGGDLSCTNALKISTALQASSSLAAILIYK